MPPPTNDPQSANQIPDDGANRGATPTPPVPSAAPPTGEIGGQKGPEPTRYGDWEKNGICSDF